ncbi:MAG: cytochrome c oxidase accessory protein CcoG [Azospirillum sp.]|nr:cytochrome c oxidase accessory protein CcoG [Azospirillum sp.]
MSTIAELRVSHPDDHEPPPKARSLFAEHVKVYPRSVQGTFRRLKWALLVLLLGVYYLTPWIRWDRGPEAPDQAVLVDMTGRRLYFFFIELWPQQIYYLTGVLIFCAVGLFLVTTLFGRLWCGYACPQTVWTDLFLWVERQVEGERGPRIRLDKGPWTAAKIARKTLKHAIWLVISVATGGAWIFYFTDAPTLTGQMLALDAPSTTMWFIALFSATTYLLAGWAREQVCIYMCPWPRFQAAMQDEDSMIVTYQAWRGEGRGSVRKGVTWEERLAQGGGDCVDCGVCHHACPTGIDIRDGNQLACIGCGLCIDACNTVMSRLGRPRQLITFDTQNNQFAKAVGKTERFRLIRPRTVIYALILVTLAGAMIAGLVLRPHLDISVLRDRAPLFVALSGGDIRNGYTFKISNMTRYHHDYVLRLAGLPGATMAVAGRDDEGLVEVPLTAKPDSVVSYRILVRAPRTSLTGASTPLDFVLTSLGDRETALYDSVFLGPARPER